MFPLPCPRPYPLPLPGKQGEGLRIALTLSLLGLNERGRWSLTSETGLHIAFPVTLVAAGECAGYFG